jgi:hypothetical protein
MWRTRGGKIWEFAQVKVRKKFPLSGSEPAVLNPNVNAIVRGN